MHRHTLDTDNYRRERDLIQQICSSNAFHMPVRYILGLTNDCNLRCPFCFMEKIADEKVMQRDDWLHVLDQLPDYARVILFGGEPLYYRHFGDIYREAASRFRCTVVTNGTLLDEPMVDLLLSGEGLYELAVSVDEIGNHNRGFTAKQWETLVRGLRMFSHKKRAMESPPKVGIDAVILDETADKLFDLHRFAWEELACDHMTYCLLNGTSQQLSDRMRPYEALFEPPDIPIYNNWETIREQLDAIRAYDRERGHPTYFRPKLVDLNSDVPTTTVDFLNQPVFDGNYYARCTYPRSDCRVYGDGSVISCLPYPFGNLHETKDLRTILTGERAQRFRAGLQEYGFYPQCARCIFLYPQVVTSNGDKTTR